MRIEIICTGDEVLTGATVNTNFSHISQRLGDAGFEVLWGSTVGDDRATLLAAFETAAQRSDAVIVNGGLGPTVDDLSQEIAARAAGVELEFHSGWYATMEQFFHKRARVMPASNRKQAMLPAGAEVLDNPIGTACGFALDIGKARFFFTPGVPRELHRMLDEQIIPRLQQRSGRAGTSRLKRFHSYGIGESRADTLLKDIEAMLPEGGLKLGFRAHYPQLETKLTMRGSDSDDVARKLAPVEEEVRRRLGHFIVAEDELKLETVLLAELSRIGASLSTAETFTGGALAARLAHLAGAESVFRRAVVARQLEQLGAAVGLAHPPAEYSREAAIQLAQVLRQASGSSHALALLVELDAGADRIELGGQIHIAIATASACPVRSARMLGGREWIRLGAIELGLDCLRRYLQGRPIDERVDFERV
jgi:nicotinamide-nucleotide amidase